MIEDLQKAINEIDYEKIRVLAISSSDPAIFSSGHNLKELTTENGTELHAKIFKKFTKLCLNLKNLPIPTIAEVAGLAAAAGLQLAASCDILIASKKASFSTPGVKFGVNFMFKMEIKQIILLYKFFIRFFAQLLVLH